MKKIILVMILPLIFLVGCDGYPYIRYVHSWYNFDANSREINVKDGYELNQGNSYEWVETEGGYDLVLHFCKGE